MPFILAYIIKLSVSLGIMYLFYQLVLRRLTFYNWNRVYLMSYSVFCFLIPLIDITPSLERSAIKENAIVQLVPTIYPATTAAGNSSVIAIASFSWTVSDWLLFVIAVGMGVMLIRLVVQLVSFRLMLRNAKLISADGVKIYQLSKKITPFSFGNSIFLNQHMHDEVELSDIIKHEFVHVKQKHTADILWAELLCIVNWYNPFAWMIRYAIKQNLEFIADNKVIESGIDRKTYQYLLLKVLGNNYYAITMPFNFSSLKKRITMMNKLRNTKVHLLKFLFILPVMIVLLLSFRGESKKLNEERSFTVAGLIFENETMKPVAGIAIADSVSGVRSVSNYAGYYELRIPVKDNKRLNIHLQYQKLGQKELTNTGSLQTEAPVTTSNDIVFIGISEKEKNSGLYGWGAARVNGQTVAPTYAIVMEKFKALLESKNTDSVIAKSSKPIQFIGGIPYACGISSKAWFSDGEFIASRECKVWVDGKIMSIEEVNSKYTRFQFDNVGAMSREETKEKLNLDCNLLMLFNGDRPSFLNPKIKTARDKPISKVPTSKSPVRKLTIQEPAGIDTLRVVADGMEFKNDTLRFKGNVEVTFKLNAKDSVTATAEEFYTRANKNVYFLLREKYDANAFKEDVIGNTTPD